MPVLAANGKEVESLQKKLEALNLEIEAVQRRKLITIVGSNVGALAKLGPSDKVIFVEPYDLRGKDPEEMVEVVEFYVKETKIENDIAYHKTGTRNTGVFKKRHELEPGKYLGYFGPTYKIDTTNQNGAKEFQEFMRTLDTHTNRLGVVPEPVAYHSDMNNEGMLDLRNVTIEKEDVPVAVLERYKPLEDLLAKKSELEKQIQSQRGN